LAFECLGFSAISTTGSCASSSRGSGSSPQPPSTEGLEEQGTAQYNPAGAGGMSGTEGDPPAAPGANEEVPAIPVVLAPGAAALSASAAALGEEGLPLGEDDADMGRLQAMLEARGFPPHLAGVLGPRMHHLILNRSMAPSAMSKAQQLLTGLQAVGDESRQLQAVIEMCQLLVMGNEDTLAGFPIRQVVPSLIVLLKMEHNFDLMNHASRALTYMMEALPRSSAVIVDAIPTFLEKLQAIQCMDVAEQSLTALEMLSKKHNKAILHAKGVPSCLMYLDFFSISAQNKALTVASNCCLGLLSEEFPLVKEAICTLASRLTNDDRKSVETACLALSRLADSFKLDAAKLQEIAKPQVLTNLQQLLVTQPLVSPNTFTTCLHILVILAGNGSKIGQQLLKQDMGRTIHQLLVSSEPVESSPGSSKVSGSNRQVSGIFPSAHDQDIDLVPRSPQELYEITCLVGEMLPPLPGDGVFAVDALLASPGAMVRDPVAWQWQDDRGVWHTYGYNDCRSMEVAFLSGESEVQLVSNGRSFTINLASKHEIREDSGTARPVQRLLTSQLDGCIEVDPIDAEARSQLTAHLTKILFPVMLEVYSASAGPGVKHAALQAMLKMVVHTETQLLAQVLHAGLVSHQVAAMLSSQDLKIIVSAQQLSEILLEKLPEQFSVHFRREGVLHQVQKLTDPDYSFSGPSDSGMESSLNMSWNQGANTPPMQQGRSWTIAGSSFANMFPEHLRHRSARDDPGKAGSSRESPDSTPQPPMRLSDMLKRKRVPSKKATRKSGAAKDETSSTAPLGMPILVTSTPVAQTSGSTPRGSGASGGNRSRLSSASSLLSSLHPSRWVKSTPAPMASESASPHAATPTHQQIREKVKMWARDQAGKFLEKYFKESLGSRHPALTILRRLSAQVDHLAKKPRDGERCLNEIVSILVKNDMSPFEVTQSGMVHSLLSYLTRPDLEFPGTGHPSHPTTQYHTTQGRGREVERMTRVRTFLHVFMGCPRSQDSAEEPNNIDTPKFSLLVSKLNACVNHLEQFPIKMYDMASGPTGVRSAGSTLKFFKTHHLKCSLQRHPDCSSLKSWKGGLVKIDPLALVQAIERYLVSRGYGRPSDKDSGSDDDDMSDDGPDDTLNNTGRDRAIENTTQRLEFLMGDQVLPRDMTMYQAVQQFGGPNSIPTDDSDSDNRHASLFGSPGVWAKIHTIHYRPAQDLAPGITEETSTSKGKSGKGHSGKRKDTDELWNGGIAPTRVNPLKSFLTDTLPKGFIQDPSLEVLCLLRVLHALNRYWYTLYTAAESGPNNVSRNRPIIPNEEFVNAKMTAKVNRQLQDPIVIMTSNLPPWLKEIGSVCPFLFPFSTRQLLFYVTSFDRDRALHRLLDATPELGVTDTHERVTPDLDRKKRVISRETILKQAEQLMTELAASRSLLEIQYEGEVGTGLGPTLEFYTLVSKELQRADLQLWKGGTVKIGIEEAMDEDNPDPCIEYVHSDTGLYPLPLARNAKSSQKTKIKNKFQFIGKFIAKAVLDNRMVDLPFSRPFYKWLLQEEVGLNINDLRGIDPDIAKTLTHLQGIIHKKAGLESDTKLTAAERQDQISQLTMDGCPIEDLGLDFTLPGFPGIELRKGGRDMSVTLDNLEQYVSLVNHWMLIEGVSIQMEALREGFNSVFPISSLQMFYPDELDQIFCGSMGHGFAPWDFKTLSESCHTKHGYTLDSPAIVNLFEIMSFYDQDEQRAFLQFVTGCPRLPVGGFKSLSPQLTIVKKTFDTSEVNPDDYLPSVMTCANYLKLPDYSIKKIMKDKLSVASLEGQYSFHLS